MKKYQKILVALLILILIIIILPPIFIIQSTKNKIFTLENIPPKKVAIVFGAAVWRNKVPSDILADRVKVASQLFHKGKVEKILMTGDNSRLDHHEPLVMKNFAISLGVPAEKIFLDHAGFRTFDSCFRAKKIFQLQEAIVVSQNFHLPRIIFLCQSFGLKSFGVPADLRKYKNKKRNFIRENLARSFAFLEVYFFPHKSKFLGEKVDL